MKFLKTGEEKLASLPQFDLVGRDEDIQKIGSLLIRQMSNSLIISGPSGVGLSTLCMGLEKVKTNKDTPLEVANKKLYWLDVDKLFSESNSANLNKEFERILDMLKTVDQSVLIIENGKTFVDSIQHANVNNFLNQLVTVIKRGWSQIIITCKSEDVSYFQNSHSDIRDQFTLVEIEEPRDDELKSIVSSAAERLTQNTFSFSDEAIQYAIDLSNKYRGVEALKGAQPTRAIDLLDRTLATFLSKAHATHPQIPILMLNEKYDEMEVNRLHSLYEALRPELDKIQLKISQLQHELLQIKEKSNNEKSQDDKSFNILDQFGGNDDDYDIKQQLQTEINLQTELYNQKLKQLDNNIDIPADFVVAEFSEISGISSAKLNENSILKLQELEARINQRVFGQEHATKALSDAVMVSTIGKRNKYKPKTAFMFMGPSGVGKTEIAKALASNLLDDENSLTRFDMSEYMEKHAVAKLIGAPPGYEGFEVGGILTNLMHKNPSRIILFDEVEKAHPDVFNVFLQILDDGRLTDNVGRTVSFSEAIIIMTTNTGQPYFLDSSLKFEEAEKLAKADLDNTYRSEFLNRFNGRQNIICFNRLQNGDIARIIDREFDNLVSSYESGIGSDIQFTYDADGIRQFVDDHYDPKVGARGLPGFISSTLEPVLVRNILSNNGNIMITYDNETKQFKVENY